MKPLLTFLLSFFYFISYAQVFNPTEIHMYWKDSKGKPYVTFDQVIKEHPKVRFLMNAGMYDMTFAPVGLYIEKAKKLRSIKIIHNPRVNYGISPSGVFYITSKKAFVTPVNKKSRLPDAIYATQSGPMLVINRKINSHLPKGSKIMRNGVGILKDGKVLFACKKMDFKEFAKYFISQGCKDALYLGGGISDTWQKGESTGFQFFGPMIGVE